MHDTPLLAYVLPKGTGLISSLNMYLGELVKNKRTTKMVENYVFNL
jgi:hypothetical protein